MSAIAHQFDKITVIAPRGESAYSSTADDPQIAKLLARGWQEYRRWTVRFHEDGTITSSEMAS
jgi:hypothetical protein